MQKNKREILENTDCKRDRKRERERARERERKRERKKEKRRKCTKIIFLSTIMKDEQ